MHRRIRLRTIPDVSKASLHGFIRQAVAPGSTVQPMAGRLSGAARLRHDRQVQSHQPEEEHLLRARIVISLLKRWLLERTKAL